MVIKLINSAIVNKWNNFRWFQFHIRNILFEEQKCAVLKIMAEQYGKGKGTWITRYMVVNV